MPELRPVQLGRAQRCWTQGLWFGLALVTWSCGTTSDSTAASGGASAGGSESSTSGVANAGQGDDNAGVGGSTSITPGGNGGTAGGAAGQAAGGEAGSGANTMVGGDGGMASEDGGPSCTVCDSYGAAQPWGTIADSNLNAISGMAASAANPGVLYVHNDRDQPEFFAINDRGVLLRTLALQGATVMDVEDIAVGPCPQGSCVYLADLGDNVTPRQEYVVVRVAEPTVDATQPGDDETLPSETLTFSYPDGTHNAESLLIDHATQNLYVVTKEAAGVASSVYRLPTTFGAASSDATKVADLTVPGPNDTPATAADAHPCGVAFLLRTNNTLYEFRIPEGEPFESLFAVTPNAVPFGDEQQGEAVAYSPDGLSYFTTSEGDNPPIHRTECRP